MWHAETNYGHSAHLFAIQTQSCPMAHRDKLWSFCALFSSRGDEPDDMQRQIMVITHTFSPSRHNRVWWLAETDYGHSAPFCHLETASPMTCGDKLWSFCTPFHHPDTIVSDGMQRQIMVILRLFAIQRRWARWHAETNYGHSAHLFAIQTQSCPMARRDKLWSFCAFFSSRGGEPDDMQRQIMVILHTFCHPDTIVSDGTQRQIMVILHLVSTERSKFGSIRMMLVVRCWSFSKFLQVPLVEILTGRMMFCSNEISVLSLLPFISNKNMERGATVIP